MGCRTHVGRVRVGYDSAHGRWTGHDRHHAAGRISGFEVEEMTPRGRIFAALAVLAPVALSGLVLAFTPVWWIFTTYFWVAFPALGLLSRGIREHRGGRARVSSASVSGEKEILEALRHRGELTPARAAMETTLSVAEADATLKKLAEAGHLEMRVRGGGIFYALWESEDGHPALTKVR